AVLELGLLPSYDAWRMKAKRAEKSGIPLRLKAGKGPGSETILNWQYLPSDWKSALIENKGNPEKFCNPLENHFTMDGLARAFYETFRFDDGTALTPEQVTRYTVNASALKALNSLKTEMQITHKTKVNPGTRDILWNGLFGALETFNNHLKITYGCEHNLKTGERLKGKLGQFVKNGDYLMLIDGRNKLANAAKVKDETDRALIEELLNNWKNLDNEQIAELYNMVVTKMGKKPISGATVGNWRKKLGFFTYAGQKGETNLQHNKLMQVKRKAPSLPMVYVTIDGWDVELLYQAKNDKNVTTYHNRATVVVVLDPVEGLNYPLGYAVGTHETPELIKAALRNAANHSRELFGNRYKIWQIQSDNYGRGSLTYLYEGMCKHYTPAMPRNHKAKVIEPYFKYLNKKCQLLFPNWSGFSMTSRKESQPNGEYLNKIRKSFPDYEGVVAQVEQLMQLERKQKQQQYLEGWKNLPVEDRLELPTEQFLWLFGEQHSHTNKLQHNGFTPTLLGEKTEFDTFDLRFREFAYMDWAIKYDPEDLSEILVVNAQKNKSNGEVDKLIGTHRFMLEQKYVQPMALYDRKEGDAKELNQVFKAVKEAKKELTNRRAEMGDKVRELFLENKELDETLTKFLLVDNKGQHKNQKNQGRGQVSAKTTKALEEPYEIIEESHRIQY
ncbi:MAG: hypothetical protein H0X63_09265, partial [Flavobacteriales bacterium]|nr:hypothetical protein [Flavobacteriales bacterium]